MCCVDPDKYRNSDKTKVIWKVPYLKPSDSGKDLSIFINGEARGPAIGLDIKKWGLGIAAGVRYRYLNSLTKTSDEVGKLIIQGTKAPDLLGNQYNNEHGYLNSIFLNEFYGTLGKVLVQEDTKFIKIGASAKYYVSNSFNNIFSNSFDFRISTNALESNRQDLRLSNVYGSVTDASQFNSINTANFTSQMTQFSGIGKGFGGDLGIIYEYRPDFQNYYRNIKGKKYSNPTQNKYLYKVGFSLVDIGIIKFGNLSETNGFSGNSSTIFPHTYGKFNGFENVIATTNGILSTTNPANNSFIVLMPASSIFTIDYHLKENFYVNFNWRQSLLNGKRRGVIGYSGAAITPRFEKKSFEAALPIGIDNNYKNLNVGFSLRYYGFFFGSDNITGWLNTFNPRGLSIYSGLFIPIYHRLPNSPLKCFYVENPKSYRKKRFKLKKQS